MGREYTTAVGVGFNLPVLNKLVQQHGDLFEVPGVEVELLTTVVSR